MATQSMRPKWNGDTYTIPVSDGVYLRGNNQRLLLKGKSLYPLLERLIPLLNGNVTLEELTAGLAPDKKRMIVSLIEKLCAQHFLKDMSQDQYHTLHSSELETYATNIAFLESFQTSAPYRFEIFRNKRVLLIGFGPGLTSLLQASLQCGLRQMTLLPVREDEEPCHLFQEASDQLLINDARQTLHAINAPSWGNEVEVRQVLQGYDAVLHIADTSTTAHALLINRLCVDEQKMLIQAFVGPDHAWIGPLVSPGMEGCWECAWRRLQANHVHLAEGSGQNELDSSLCVAHNSSLTLAAANLIAQQLLFALFRSFAQTEDIERARKVRVMDLKTFQSESHTFLPHPHCQACQHPMVPTASQFLERVQQLQQAPFAVEDFLKHIAECIDEQCGLFTRLTTASFVQMPLAVYKVHLANPCSGEGQPASFDIIATSLDTKEAIIRTLFNACQCYASHFVDRRGWLSADLIQHLASPVISTGQLVGVPASEEEWWTWALDLQTQQAALVPASPMFPQAGIGSGTSWQEAVCQALLSWCNFLTIERLHDTPQPYLQIDLAHAALPSSAAHLYRLLTATGKQITAYDVTGCLRVPTFAVCLDEKVVAYATHCNTEQALSMGLERALQHYQSNHFHQADYAPDPVPDCPAHLRSERVCLPCYTSPETWEARQDWLLQHLQASGLRSFALPLDADPALKRALPFLVRILLSQTKSEKGA